MLQYLCTLKKALFIINSAKITVKEKISLITVKEKISL